MQLNKDGIVYPNICHFLRMGEVLEFILLNKLLYKNVLRIFQFLNLLHSSHGHILDLKFRPTHSCLQYFIVQIYVYRYK